MAYYKNQIPVKLMDGVTLTDSFDDNAVISDIKRFTMITIYIEYTPQENNSSFFLQTEAGIDDTKLFPKVALVDKDLSGESVSEPHIIRIDSNGAGKTLKRRLLIEPADLKIRVSTKESVVSSYGSLNIYILKHEE